MSTISFQDETFDRISFVKKGEYESCAYTNCDLQEADLSGCRFIDCVFEGCNLSLAKLDNASFQSVRFKGCKLLGLRFDHCDPFGMAISTEGCQMNHCSFYKLKLRKTVFRNTQLQECDFTETDLTAASLDGCDLARAVFDRTILEKADLRHAINFSIDPERNKVRKAILSVSGLAGLLHKYDIKIEA